mgnify:CR=1 FL=1
MTNILEVENLSKSFGGIKANNNISFEANSGEIIGINEELNEKPELVNEDPYGQGWMIEIEFSNSSPEQSLLSADQYREQCKNQE